VRIRRRTRSSTMILCLWRRNPFMNI
jgi:hypothetical protein